jgi:quercetin dioxygenase-like cupin family protein
MRIFRGVLGKTPSQPKGRVRNFIANKELGTLSDIHENVISPGVTVPWHFHETEEVIVVLDGNGECRTDQGTEAYFAGDVIILPALVQGHEATGQGPRTFVQRPVPANTASGSIERDASDPLQTHFQLSNVR